jgi:hypothetical protein
MNGWTDDALELVHGWTPEALGRLEPTWEGRPVLGPAFEALCAACGEQLTEWEARVLAHDVGQPLCVPCVRSTAHRRSAIDRKRRALDRVERQTEWLSVDGGKVTAQPRLEPRPKGSRTEPDVREAANPRRPHVLRLGQAGRERRRP